MSRSNEELAFDIQQGVHVRENMEELYQNNRKLILYWAQKFPYSDRDDVDEMLSEGFICLDKAVRNYNPHSGMFSTFFSLLLRQHFAEYVRKKQGISYFYYVGIMKTDKAMAEIQDAGGTVTETEVRKRTGFTPGQMKNINSARMFKRRASLDKAVAVGDDGEETFLRDILTDETDFVEDVTDRISKQQDAERLHKALETAPLNDREREVIRMIYYDDYILQDVAKKYNVGHTRIGQIHQAALKKLRAELRKYHSQL